MNEILVDFPAVTNGYQLRAELVAAGVPVELLDERDGRLRIVGARPGVDDAAVAAVVAAHAGPLPARTVQ